MYRQIILDFDGVILESVAVKTEAFRILFAAEEDHVEEIVRFHQQNGGMSRFDKFRHIYQNILHRDLDDDTFNSLSSQFSRLVLQGVIASPFVEGALVFLQNYHTRIPLYIVSATPEPELKDIVRLRNLGLYFREICGSPRRKDECIRTIIAKGNASPADVLFVGDAKNDWSAAQSSGVHFIGRIPRGGKNLFAGFEGIDAVVMDLNELSRYLEGDP